MKEETPEETMRRLQAHVERRNPNLPIEDVMAKASMPPEYQGHAEDFEADQFFFRQRAARKKRKRTLIFSGVAIFFLLVVPLVAGAINSSVSENAVTDSGPAVNTSRSKEAKAVVERFTLPPEWTAVSEPELSGDGEDYSFYRTEYKVNNDYTGEKLKAWFRETSAIDDVREEARCTETMDRSSMECSAQFRALDANGYPDYDQPRQTFTARYTNVGGEVRVSVEGYSTS